MNYRKDSISRFGLKSRKIRGKIPEKKKIKIAKKKNANSEYLKKKSRFQKSR